MNDGAHAYTFDAENKISKVDNVAAYVYNGEGQRVRKLVGENLRFIYGLSGQEIAEFDGSTGALKKEYIYGPGGLLASIEPTAVNANGTRYTTPDTLGSPRLVTNSSGSVVSRHDFKPLGEELGAGIGGRTTGMGYSVADGLRQTFTSKERDNETGLDFFAARYYASTQGRFTSADSVGGTRLNPQTLNLYAYVTNNPLKFVDPTGHILFPSEAAKRQQQEAQRRQDERDYREWVAEGVIQEFFGQSTTWQGGAAASDNQDRLQDAVIGFNGEPSPGVDDRFNEGHYGAHTLSPEEGGNAISLPSLSGTVVYWNTQEPADPRRGLPALGPQNSKSTLRYPSVSFNH